MFSNSLTIKEAVLFIEKLLVLCEEEWSETGVGLCGYVYVLPKFCPRNISGREQMAKYECKECGLKVEGKTQEQVNAVVSAYYFRPWRPGRYSSKLLDPKHPRQAKSLASALRFSVRAGLKETVLAPKLIFFLDILSI